MKGNPKFKEGDSVQFSCNGKLKNGIIYIVDKYGTFEDPSGVSYDILVEKENCLYKHFTEKLVSRHND